MTQPTNLSLLEIRREVLKIKHRQYGIVPVSDVMKRHYKPLYVEIIRQFGDYRTFRNWLIDPTGYKPSWSYRGDDSLIAYVDNHIKPQYGLNMPTQSTLQKDGHSTFAAKAHKYKQGDGMRGLIKDCGMTTKHVLPKERNKTNIIEEARAIAAGNPKTLPHWGYLREHHSALLCAINRHFSSLTVFAACANLDYTPKQTKWNDTLIIDALKALAGQRNEWPGKWRVETIRGLYRAISRRGGPKLWCEKLGWAYGHIAADGHYYDSNAEVLVANLLRENNIHYERTVSNAQTAPYIPDFHLPEYNLFVEVLMCDCEQKQDATVRQNYCERWSNKQVHYTHNKVPFITIRPDELETTQGVESILRKIQSANAEAHLISTPLRQSTSKGHGYWKNWSVISKLITEITQDIGYMPRREDFLSDENNQPDRGYQLKRLYNAIHKNFNGLEKVAERMNLAPSPERPNQPGYWSKSNNVMLELAIEFYRHGKFPTTYELNKSGQSTLVNAILKLSTVNEVQSKFMHYIMDS